MNKVLATAHNQRWRDLLINSVLNDADYSEEFLTLLNGSDFSDCLRFGVESIILSPEKTFSTELMKILEKLGNEYFGYFPEKYAYQFVEVSPHHTVLVVGFTETESAVCAGNLLLFSHELLDLLHTDLSNSTLCCISGIKSKSDRLPTAYR